MHDMVVVVVKADDWNHPHQQIDQNQDQGSSFQPQNQIEDGEDALSSIMSFMHGWKTWF